MSERNGAGSLAIPGQIKIDVIVHDGPHANPIVVGVPSHGKIEAHSFGGLTKLQAAAAPILGGLIAQRAGEPREGLAITPSMVLEAVNVANSLLKACELFESQQRSGVITQ